VSEKRVPHTPLSKEQRAGNNTLLLRGFLVFALIFSLFAGRTFASASAPQSSEYHRAKVLAFVLRQDLSNLHFSHKKIDDTLSKDAFSQYLKQLDGQKILLLKEDVEKLSFYSTKIGDEINKGTFELPLLVADILAKRAAAAEKMATEILAGDFDFSADEYYETDPDKIAYCDTEKDLRERWGKYLKLQVLQQYFSLRENAAAEDKDGKKTPQKPEALLQTARERVQRSHTTFFSRIREIKERENYDRFFNAVAKTFDPHTEYMPPANKEDFDIDMRGTLEGIGATLKEEDGYIKVVSVVPGSPAARDGNIHSEDVILKVGEKDKEPVDISFMSVRDAVKLIRGKKGTEVKLSIKKPDGNQLVVSVIRDVIKLEDSSVKGASLKDENSGRSFGYLKIPSFYRDFENTRNGGSGRNSTDDVLKELKKIETGRISGLIIDLRNNGGGALTDAIKTAGLFIKTGPVVQVKGSDGKISVLSDDNPDISYAGPIVVLVNKFSASASEILAAALQDYGRAIVMGGEHTHGKGTVQTIIDLNNFYTYHGGKTAADINKDDALGALRLTTQKFYRITGGSTQYRGVTPDIILPDQFQGIKSGEQFLDFALPWDTIQPVSYARWTGPRIDLGALRARSSKRIGSKQEFIDMSEQSRELLEQQKKTLQPLNMDEAAKQRKTLAAMKAKHAAKKAKLKKETEKGQDSSDLSDMERRQLWLKEVDEDPYVREGIAVLTDLLTENTALHLDDAPAVNAALTTN
jgi:carboxyl-terminal processing protease